METFNSVQYDVIDMIQAASRHEIWFRCYHMFYDKNYTSVL